MSRSQEANLESHLAGGTAPRPWTILADDLTGACDAAVAFVSQGRTVRVLLDQTPFSTADVSAISTGTRDTPEAQAVAAVSGLARTVPAHHDIFKKIDSVFRGNTFAEIVATVVAFPADLVLIAPAYPHLGRRLLAGRLIVDDHGATRECNVAEELTRRGCHLTPLPAAADCPENLLPHLQRIVQDGSRVILADALTQRDLQTTANAVRQLGLRTLWIGSGGLAHALAEPRTGQPTAATPDRCGTTLFFIGSDHPATQGQVRHLRQTTGWELQSCSAPVPHADGLMLHVLRGETSAEDIRRAAIAVPPSQVCCLFITGGDTAQTVCSALGITSLRLQHEFAPGVPLAVAEGGPFNGTSVILKSGGFGSPDLLHRVAEAFTKKEQRLTP